MTFLWFAFLAVSCIMGFALFVWALNRWPVVGAIAVATNVLVAWELPYPQPLASVGGVSIYFLDVLAAGFLAIGIGMFGRYFRSVTPTSLTWFGLGLLLLVSLVRGVIDNPFGPTMNEFRSYLYPYAALTWAMSLRWNFGGLALIFRRFVVVLGWGLVLVAVYHTALHGFGSASGFVDAGTGMEQTTRPLVSGQALVLLMCAMACLWYWRRFGRNSSLVSAVIFLLTVAIAQQRTVWAVALAAAAAVLIVSRSGTKALIIASSLAALWLGAAVSQASITSDLLMQLSRSASDLGTYDARVKSWMHLIEQSVRSGPENVIFGQPMGTGFGRFEGFGRWVEFAPHNWYLTIYLRVGVLGLTLLCVFLLSLLVSVLQRRSNMAEVALLISIIVYGWSYSWPWYIGIFFGWAVGSYLDDARQPRQQVPPGLSSLSNPRVEETNRKAMELS